MLKLVTCAVSIACVVQFCFAADEHSDPAQAKAAYEDGQKLEIQRRYEDAIQAYKVASDKCPEQAEYRIKQALAYEHIGKWDEAIKCYSDALALNPENASYKTYLVVARTAKAAYLHRQGQLKDAKGDLKGAVADYRAALEIVGSDAIILGDLTGALSRMGYKEDAHFEIQKRQIHRDRVGAVKTSAVDPFAKN